MKDVRNTGKHEAVRTTGGFKAVTGAIKLISESEIVSQRSGRHQAVTIEDKTRLIKTATGARPIQPMNAVPSAGAGNTGVRPIQSAGTGSMRVPSATSSLRPVQPTGTGSMRVPNISSAQRPVQPAAPASTGSASASKKSVSKRAVYITCTVIAAILIIVIAILLKTASDKHSYENYYISAVESYNSKDYDNALSSLRKALQVESTDECLSLMAYCYEAQGNYDKCLETLRSMNTSDADVQARIAKIETVRKSLTQPDTVTVAGNEYPADSTSLVLKDKGITNETLGEVVQLYALSNLTLSGNSITDISVLSSLGGLTTLDISGNSITDISPLSKLTGLRNLYIDNNPITDLTPLYTLSSLTSLSIKGVEITENQLKTLSEALPSCAIHSEEATEDIVDITLGGITFKSDVTTLDLSYTGISDISVISQCKALTVLDLSGNNIRDLAPLMDVPGLVTLNISSNSISDLRPLMALSTITTLNAEDNSITSTVALSSLSNLKELYLSSNLIEDYSGLGKLKNLTRLSLASTELSDEDLPYLYKAQSLLYLDITDNTDISGEEFDKLQSSIANCKIYHSDLVYSVTINGEKYRQDSTELDLSSRNLTDLSNLYLFSSLETLDLSGNGISNIYNLEWVKSLKRLDLSENLIEDITPISSLMDLEMLDLRNNNIFSILPLMKLSKLEVLYLSGNNITEEQIATLKNALPNCDIYTE